jgi:hypothetical protein
LSLHDDYLARLEPWSDIQDCLVRLHEWAARIPRVAVLELGVRSGNSTAAFLAAAERADGHVWSVDIDTPGVPAQWHDCGRWTFTLGDDMIVTTPPGPFDILFIDSSHRCSHTLAELRKFVPLVRPGGRVLAHDTRLEHVDGEPAAFPVAKALGVFCQETGLSWADHDAQYGLGEIVIPG